MQLPLRAVYGISKKSNPCKLSACFIGYDANDAWRKFCREYSLDPQDTKLKFKYIIRPV